MTVPCHHCTDMLRFMDSPVTVVKGAAIGEGIRSSVAAGSGLTQYPQATPCIYIYKDKRKDTRHSLVFLDVARQMTTGTSPTQLQTNGNDNKPSGRKGTVESRKGLIAGVLSNWVWQCCAIIVLPYFGFWTAP
ncbi:hypothetical protein CSKR_106981 [Clonorchis sinensis]|uniref:Uncharacterized protein n=1 Tax=Clonorchis sinensis TaxID=79923 RepID=A0A3R7F153_CLOSI|nr:hypothetical protein CSKR_106981 [Clonorchis sinensis]